MPTNNFKKSKVLLSDLQKAFVNGTSLYLSVQNQVLDVISDSKTKMSSDGPIPQPLEPFRRHWKVSILASDPGTSLQDVIKFMTNNGLIDMDFIATSPVFPHAISHKYACVQFYDESGPVVTSFDDWGEVDDNGLYIGNN